MKKGMYVSCNGQLWLVGGGGRGTLRHGVGKERRSEGGWEGDDGGLEEVGICDIAFGGVTMVVTVVLR